MAINVIKPGLATSVQDAGRIGYYNLGIPLSGALDQYSFRAANLLVGNDENAAVLEICLLGPELYFDEDTLIAVTGAVLDPKVDGRPVPRNVSFQVRAGSTLSFDYIKAGARAYLAVAGGIDVPSVLGSRSTYGLGAFGGYKGRTLLAGDRLPVGAASEHAVTGKELPAKLQQKLPHEATLRVLPGLYQHRLTEASAQRFFDDVWTVGSEANRIGYRYRGGSPLMFKERTQPFGAGSDPSNIVDAAYPIGSIQVPGGVEPIILHRDAVSGGGYATIGTVISADMDIVGQMKPNDKALFVPVDMKQALEARKRYRERMESLRRTLGGSAGS